MGDLGGGSCEEIWEKGGPEIGDPPGGANSMGETRRPGQLEDERGQKTAGNTAKTLKADIVCEPCFVH